MEDYDLYVERMMRENPKQIEIIKLAWDFKAPPEEIVYTGNTLIRVTDYRGNVLYDKRVGNDFAEDVSKEVMKKFNIKEN